MTAHSSDVSQQAAVDPREIAKWANRYAKSRTIPFLVQWVFIVLLGVLIAVAAYVTLLAYKSENTLWFVLCASAIVGILIALTWFMVPKWGGDKIYQISQWFYGEEGYADYVGIDDEEAGVKAPLWIYLIGIGVAVYHLAGAVLIATRHLHLDYLQPFSALYMVPFFVIMAASQRLGFWAYIWPALYGLHAILIWLDAPIRFTSVNLIILNMIIPVFGYGLVAIIVGHFYSRYALRKLKMLARTGLVDEPATDDEEEAEREND